MSHDDLRYDYDYPAELVSDGFWNDLAEGQKWRMLYGLAWRTVFAVIVAFMAAMLVAAVVVMAGADAATPDRLERICPRYPEDPRCAVTVTTETPPTTATTMPPTAHNGTVAAIGCSNTKDAAEGYLAASSSDRLVIVAAGGHTVGNWANGRSWTERYIGFRPADGYTAAWFQLCDRERSGLHVEDVLTVLDRIWETDPGITVFLSPMNYYATEDCDVTGGNSIPEAGAVIADDLAATMPLVERGPDLGPLQADQVRRDDCHPNSAGVALLGDQLVAWFD